MTPMQRQYETAKERHPEALLLFRMGDFYELFADDARVAAKALGLALTTRDKAIDMAGFPHHALESHLRKLIAAGHRVAILEPVDKYERPLGEKLVTRIVVPGRERQGRHRDERHRRHGPAKQGRVAPSADGNGFPCLTDGPDRRELAVREYPIKRPVDEAECDECGASLHVGDIAVWIESEGALFCSEDCAAFQFPTPEHPRGHIHGLPVENELANDTATVDGFLADLSHAICEMEGIECQGLLFPD